MRAVVYRGSGVEAVQVEDRPDLSPQGDEVLIEPAYAGINPADLQQRDGNYPAPKGAPSDIPGLEVAGTVTAVGDRVIGLEPGQRVMGLVAGGGLASQVVVAERAVCPIPDSLDDLTAAAVPEGFITAHDAAVRQAGLRPGDVLVISGASGGVGSAAVQIGVMMGARVIGTSRTESGRQLIESLGAHAAAPDQAGDAIADISGGRGADVILELVGAPAVTQLLPHIATLGRYMVVGVGTGNEIDLNLRFLMSRRARILATVLRARPVDEKAAAVQAFAREVLPHIASGRITPIVDRAFPLTEVRAAFDHMEHGVKAGKVLLDLRN